MPFVLLCINLLLNKELEKEKEKSSQLWMQRLATELAGTD